MRNEWLTAGTNDPVKPGSREGLWRAMQNWRKSRDSFRQQRFDEADSTSVPADGPDAADVKYVFLLHRL